VKILFFTDLHLRQTPPRWRKDSFAAQLLLKLQWIVDYAIKQECDRVYFGGDFVDSPQASIALTNSAIELLDQLATRQIGFTAALGQHDEVGNHPDGIRGSVASLLYRTKTTGMPRYGASHDFVLTDTAVVHYREDEFDIPLFGEQGNHPAQTHRFCVIHLPIVANPVPWPHILVTDIETDADIVFCGDYHAGWEPIEHEGTWFINPGAVARLSVGDARRQPKIAIIDTNKLPECPAEYIDIPCNRPEDAFELISAQETKDRKDRHSRYTQILTELAEQESSENWELLLEQAAEDETIEDEVLQEARRRCIIAEEQRHE